MNLGFLFHSVLKDLLRIQRSELFSPLYGQVTYLLCTSTFTYIGKMCKMISGWLFYDPGMRLLYENAFINLNVLHEYELLLATTK